MVMEGLDLIGEVGVRSGKRGIRGNELLQDGLLVGGSTRLSRALLMESRRPGLRRGVWAELAQPR